MSESHRGRYVRQVQDAAERCAQALLAENERLRTQVAVLEAAHGETQRHLAAAHATGDMAEALRVLVSSMETERVALQRRLSDTERELAAFRQERAELQERLARVEIENRQAIESYAEVTRRSSQLANLYVASYRLHETLDRDTIIEAIREIVINLVGSEEFAIFETQGAGVSLVSGFGLDPGALTLEEASFECIARAARTGEIYVGTPDSGNRGEPIACIPLRVGSRTTGVVAIFGLLAHKPALEEIDRELFDLLATQAGTALYCAGIACPDLTQSQ